MLRKIAPYALGLALVVALCVVVLLLGYSEVSDTLDNISTGV